MGLRGRWWILQRGLERGFERLGEGVVCGLEPAGFREWRWGHVCHIIGSGLQGRCDASLLWKMALLERNGSLIMELSLF